MKFFISRLYLIDSRKNSRFPAEIASLVYRRFSYKGLYGHISDFEHFFLHLKFTPKPNILDCIR